jgi:hypothetical protein
MFEFLTSIGDWNWNGEEGMRIEGLNPLGFFLGVGGGHGGGEGGDVGEPRTKTFKG